MIWASYNSKIRNMLSVTCDMMLWVLPLNYSKSVTYRLGACCVIFTLYIQPSHLIEKLEIMQWSEAEAYSCPGYLVLVHSSACQANVSAKRMLYLFADADAGADRQPRRPRLSAGPPLCLRSIKIFMLAPQTALWYPRCPAIWITKSASFWDDHSQGSSIVLSNDRYVFLYFLIPEKKCGCSSE